MVLISATTGCQLFANLLRLHSASGVNKYLGVKVKHLIEQVLNYDPELPVHIAELTEMNGHQYLVDSELIEMQVVTLR